MMNRKDKLVILVNGLPRSGKDTFADYLVDKYNFTKMSFAEDLKNILCRTFDITYEELDLYKNNPDNYSLELKHYPDGVVQNILYTDFRKILQRFATEGMKTAFGNGVWADLVYKRILESDSKLIVIPDFRFLSEYQTHFGLKIKTVLIRDDRDLPLDGHTSDVELYKNNFEFDYEIYNDKTDNYFYTIDTIKEYLCK